MEHDFWLSPVCLHVTLMISPPVLYVAVNSVLRYWMCFLGLFICTRCVCGGAYARFQHCVRFLCEGEGLDSCTDNDVYE